MLKCRPRPSPLWTRDWTWVLFGVFVRHYYKSSPLRKFFCHSNIPTRRQARALWALQSCLLCTFYSKFLLCLGPISLKEKHETFIAAVKKKWEMLAATKVKMSGRDKKPTGTLDFSKSPLQFFFPVGYTFLKDFSYLHVWRKIYREKNQPLTSWLLTNSEASVFAHCLLTVNLFSTFLKALTFDCCFWA